MINNTNVSKTYLDLAAQAQGFNNRTASPSVENAMTAGAGANESLRAVVQPQQLMSSRGQNEYTANTGELAAGKGTEAVAMAAMNQNDYKANVLLNGFIASNNLIPEGAISDMGAQYMRDLSTQMT